MAVHFDLGQCGPRGRPQRRKVAQLVVRPVARSKACRVRAPVDAFGIDPQPGASGIKSRVSVVRVNAKPGQRHIGGQGVCG